MVQGALNEAGFVVESEIDCGLLFCHFLFETWGKSLDK